MIHKMEAVQKIRLYSNDIVLKTKLFQASGKWNDRTIRLTKNSLAILNEIHPDALNYYLLSFPDNRFTGDPFRIWRNHRVGEVMAMCMMAGIETAPYILPKLQKEFIRLVVPETPSYYMARCFKNICKAESNKTMYTRVTGLLFYPHGCYAVYNTRDAVMKWSGKGEAKTREELYQIVRMNAGLEDVKSILLFGRSEDIALRTLIESDKSEKEQFRFDRIYQHIHFIPLDQNGIDLLKILTLPDWHEKLMSVLFAAELRIKGYGSVEFDAYWDNKYYYSHLDGDIARLIRFKGALKSDALSFEVICFPWQKQFLIDYLGKSVSIKSIEMPIILKALGVTNY